MFIERIREEYDPNVPIFTKNILKMFPEYSRAYVFRLIKEAEKKGEIIKYTEGVYFMPTEIVLGPSTITADDVIEKKYLREKDDVYGIYSGIKLLNNFSITTQMAGVIEVVTNYESSRCREITIKNRRYIIRKSRCKIDKFNACAYTILQVFSEYEKVGTLNKRSIKKMQEYMKENGTTKEDLFSLSAKFPAKTIQNLVGSGLLNELT